MSECKTVRLYDDPHLWEFQATVLSCARIDEGFAVVLDRTAFFPTGGGQACDGGTLGGLSVTDVVDCGDTVIHTVAEPLVVGSSVRGRIDRDLRLRRMANHTGEHLLSSVLFRRYGLTNVGFHMGSADVTCDFDGVVEGEDLRRAEEEVNLLIRENHPVSVSYPDGEALASLPYRSKRELTGQVRIVSIGAEGEVDRCACCAPHVLMTGEVGVLRILFRERYKGGVRLHILCGADALARWQRDGACLDALSTLLSAKPEGEAVQEAVCRLWEENKALTAEIARLNEGINRQICRGLTAEEGPLCLFDGREDAVALRKLALEVHGVTGSLVAVFGGREGDYRVVIADGGGLRESYRRFAEAVPCRGGGSDTLICGSTSARRSELEAALSCLAGEDRFCRTLTV